MNTALKYGIGATILGGLGYYVTTNTVKAADPDTQFDYDLKDVSLKGIQGTTIKGRINIQVINKAPVSIVAENPNFDISLKRDGGGYRKIASSPKNPSPGRIKIKANSTSNFWVGFQIDALQLGPVLVDVVSSFFGNGAKEVARTLAQQSVKVDGSFYVANQLVSISKVVTPRANF